MTTLIRVILGKNSKDKMIRYSPEKLRVMGGGKRIRGLEQRQEGAIYVLCPSSRLGPEFVPELE